ncbi:thrombospondin type 3 repeat-containing protein [Pseudomaricurvus alcaniphilus]|uniref:thrombospondin type 3 repeat-containing protein n=1 Tax=Pseudomaricurvus alcaniphilus TaxID=1166482 RepID=UPI00140C0083
MRNNVTVAIDVPANTNFNETSALPVANCSGSSCDAGETPSWELGSLAAGASRVIIVPFQQVGATSGQTFTFNAAATYTGLGEPVSATAEAEYDTSSAVELSLDARRQTVAAGGEVRYELGFGNIGATPLPGLSLEFDLPAGASLVEVSDGGSLANGVISWELGTLAAGAASKHFVRVALAADQESGDLITTAARVRDSEQTLVSAAESVAVLNQAGLALDATLVNDLSFALGGHFYYRYVLTNRGSAALADVELRVLTAEHSSYMELGSLPATDCSGASCDAGEWGYYSFGPLEAGESRVVTIPVLKTDAAVNGDVLTSRAMAQADGGAEWAGVKSSVLYAQAVKPQVAMAGRRFVVAANATQEVDIRVGNPGAAALNNAFFVLSIPSGFAVQTVSGNGLALAGAGNPYVIWPLGNIPAGGWVQQSVTLQADAGLEAGQVLILEGSLRGGGNQPGSLARAQLATVIGAEVLDVDSGLAVSGSTLNWDFLAENISAPQLTDARLWFLMPNTSFFFPGQGGAVCPDSGCFPGDWGYFPLGDFGSGESAPFDLAATVSGAAAGALLVGHVNLDWASTPRTPLAIQRLWALGSEHPVDLDHDSDGDGATDFQELQYGTDPLDSRDVLLEASSYLSLHKLWDMNGDGIEEVGQFGVRLNNDKPQLIVTDPSTGATVKSFTWEASWYNPQLVRLSDRNGDGVDELAVFGFAKADLRPQLSIKNGVSAAQLNTFSWPANWYAVQFEELDDSTNDGISELAIFGFDKASDQAKLVVRNGANPEQQLPTTSWPAIWQNVRFLQTPDVNGDGVEEVAIFGQRTGNNRNQLVIKDGVDPNIQHAIYNWGDNWDQQQILRLADNTNDGIEELGLLGVRRDDGRAQLIVKNGANRSQGVRNYGWPEELTSPEYLPVPDRDGDGRAELGMAGVRSDNGRTQIIVKRGSNQQTLEAVGWNTTWVDGKVHVLADLSGDQLHDYALLGNHVTAGYAQLVVSNSASGQTLRTFSWPSMDATQSTLVELADMNGDGIPEVGLYSAGSGSGVLEIKNGANQTQLLSRVTWPAAWY